MAPARSVGVRTWRVTEESTKMGQQPLPPQPIGPSSKTALTIAGVLIAIVVVLAFVVDDPTDFQQGVLWVLLALAAEAAASAIPGALSATFSPRTSFALSASGAIVVFLIVFFGVPAIIDDGADDDIEPTRSVASTTETATTPGPSESGGASPAASPGATPVASPMASPVASPQMSPAATPLASPVVGNVRR